MAAAVLFLSLLLVEEQAYHMYLLMAVESIHPQQQAVRVVIYSS